MGTDDAGSRILRAVDAVNAVERVPQRRLIVHVRGDDLGAGLGDRMLAPCARL
jgi:hypothetical protein